MEKIPNLNEYKQERLKTLKSSIENSIKLFLEVNGLSNVEIVWDQNCDLFTFSFSLIESDTGEKLLSGDNLHVDLARYLAKEEIGELENYTLNPYTKAGYISYIKT